MPVWSVSECAEIWTSKFKDSDLLAYNSAFPGEWCHVPKEIISCIFKVFSSPSFMCSRNPKNWRRGTTYPTRQRSIPADRKPRLRSCENLTTYLVLWHLWEKTGKYMSAERFCYFNDKFFILQHLLRKIWRIIYFGDSLNWDCHCSVIY
jgi:hypothetical protein